MRLLTQQNQDPNTFNFGQAVGGSVFEETAGPQFNFPNFLHITIQSLFVIVTIGSFLFLLVGAVQWILAGGDKEGVQKAQRKITQSLIGLAIAFSVYIIASLINAVFGIDILNDLLIPKL